jgi:hypothetical protein
MRTTFVVLGAVAYGEVQCDRRVELMILQDATTSFTESNLQMSTKAKKIIDELNAKIDGSVVVSMARFADKPVPYRGNGSGRGTLDLIDYCYDNADTFALSDDYKHIETGYENTYYNSYAEGGDYPENVYEGMMYAAMDPKVNWSSPDLVYDEEGQHIIRVLLTITDDFPHYFGEVASGVESWNPVEGDSYTFWGQDFAAMGAFYRGSEVNYPRLLELKAKVDDESISEQEKKEFDALLKLMGPDYFPPAPEHPGSFSVFQNCQDYEYPKLEQVGEVLNSRNIFPIMILSDQSFTDNGANRCTERGLELPTDESQWATCLEQIYNIDLSDAGLSNYLITHYHTDVDELVANIVNTVEKMTQDITCPDLTTTGAPTSTTTASTTKSTEATESTETTTSSAATREEKSTANSTDSQDASTTRHDQTDDTSSTAEGSTTTTTTDDGHIIPPVPVPTDGGSNTGTIAGATGGAVAGVAAVAGVLYKKFGFSPFRKSSGPEMTAVEQVETPETPVEREAYEEVTMDMFQ